MYRLLSANMIRLFSGKTFWMTLLGMAGMETVISILLLGQDSMRIDIPLYISIQSIGIFLSIVLSALFGTEYGDGTLRNKMIVGYERNQIYLAGFFTAGTAFTLFYLIWILLGCLFAFFMHIPFCFDSQMILTGVIGWLACVSYSSIFTFIGMLSNTKSKTSMMNVFSALILMFGGLLCYSLSSSGVLTGIYQQLFQLIFDVNPYGQIFQFMTVDGSTLLRLGCYSFALIFVINVAGIWRFHKKDLK